VPFIRPAIKRRRRREFSKLLRSTIYFTVNHYKMWPNIQETAATTTMNPTFLTCLKVRLLCSSVPTK
jgi:hypothetical protein